MTGALLWWRHLALAVLVLGLLLAPTLTPHRWLAAAALAVPALAAARPRGSRSATSPTATVIWLALVVTTATLTGAGIGSERLSSISSGALPGSAGEWIATSGVVATQPRRSGGESRAILETQGGRLALATEGPVPPGLRLGSLVKAAGPLAEPQPGARMSLARAGATLELRADTIELLPGARGGLSGLLDRTAAASSAARRPAWTIGRPRSPAASSSVRTS